MSGDYGEKWRFWEQNLKTGQKSGPKFGKLANFGQSWPTSAKVGQLWPTSGVLWRKVSGVHNDAKVLIYDIKVMILTTVAMMESFATR